MAYFPNSESGDAYEERYCSQCAHRKNPEEGECCPVLMLHLLWNYDQDENKAAALNSFIPRNGIQNEQCEMFIEHADPYDWEIQSSEPPRAMDFIGYEHQDRTRTAQEMRSFPVGKDYADPVW